MEVNNKDQTFRSKITVIYERELFFNDNGIPMIRRSLQENDILFFDFADKIGEDKSMPSIMQNIEDWVDSHGKMDCRCQRCFTIDEELDKRKNSANQRIFRKLISKKDGSN